MIRKLIFISILLLLLAGTAGASFIEVNSSSSSHTLNVNGGQYQVTEDFSCTATCLDAGASNMYIDLMGHTITFANTSVGNGFNFNGYDNISLTNGSIFHGNDSFGTNKAVYAAPGSNNNIISFLNTSVNGTMSRNILIDTSSGNTVKNNYIRTFGSGNNLDAAAGSNNTFLNNTVVADSGHAILFFQELNSKADNNTGTSVTGDGINIYGSDYINITNNNMLSTGTGRAIYFSVGSDHANVSENNFTSIGSSSAAGFASSTWNIFFNNTFTTYGVLGYTIYLTTSSNNNSFNDNNITCFAAGNINAIRMEDTSNNNVFNNNKISSAGTGHAILIFSSITSSNSNTINNNTITANGNGNGIYLLSSINNILTNNIITAVGTGYGLLISTTANNNTIFNNTINSNSQASISIDNSNFNNLSSNTFSSLAGENIAIKNSANRTNVFTSTNFTSTRKIKFYQTNTEFNQSQDNFSYIDTNTQTANNIITRTVLSMTQSNITIFDSNSIAGINSYNFSGFKANTNYSYSINNSELTYNTSDANGALPQLNISFALNYNTKIQILEVLIPCFICIPPTPISLLNTSGNFWVNHTWESGIGNITDSYNVSINNIWSNGSSSTFNNSTYSPHSWSNISVYAYNNSGTLNETPISMNTQLSNNPIIISGVNSTYPLMVGETLSIDANYTDADSDTGTFADNSSEWDIDSSTGIVAHIMNAVGNYFYQINVSDGYGSVSTQEFSVSVSSPTPTPTPTPSPDINTTPAISNVLNQSCEAHSCVVAFDVNQSNAITQVKYGLNESILQNTTNQTSGTSRTDNLTGLANVTKYFYSVFAWNVTNISHSTNSTIQNFTTEEDYVAPTPTPEPTPTPTPTPSPTPEPTPTPTPTPEPTAAPTVTTQVIPEYSYETG